MSTAKSFANANLIGLFVLSLSFTAIAQAPSRLSVGDVLSPEDLQRPRFASDLPIDLTQFKGKILYLEWFYWW